MSAFTFVDCLAVTPDFIHYAEAAKLIGSKRWTWSQRMRLSYDLFKPAVTERFGWGRRTWQRRERAALKAASRHMIILMLRPQLDASRSRQVERFCRSSAGYDLVYHHVEKLLVGGGR